MLQSYSGIPGVKSAVETGCSRRQDFILFLTNYSMQIVEHAFKNWACSLSSTSFPIHSSLTMATAQQAGTYTNEIKVPNPVRGLHAVVW
jgi:hypothetical protein